MKNRKGRSRVLGINPLFLAVLALSLSVRTGLAQEGRAIPTSFFSRGTVHLPIQIDDQVRPLIQEVQLYVKEGPEANWELKEKAPGTQHMFTYRTDREGEYWFNLAYVDRAGRAVPADITKEPPGLIVVVDSTPPQAEAQIVGATADGQQIRCEVHDANPDPANTRFFYQTRDRAWRALDPVRGQPDVFCIPDPKAAAITGMIRVVACDLAGNTSTREFNLASLPVANNIPFPTPKVQPNAGIVETHTEKLVMTPPLPDRMAALPKEPVVIREKTVPLPEPIEFAIKPSSMPLPQILSMEQSPLVAINQLVPGNIGSAWPGQAKTAGPELPASRHLINNSHIVLNYQIEQTGASGVGRVEIWCTRDLSKTWQKLDEDVNRKGQAELDLPGEGIYGLTVVVSNGRGFGANPPKAGDTPDWWVEVDTTKPQAELLGVPVQSQGGGRLPTHLLKRAKDKNTSTRSPSRPVRCRQSPGSTWLPIAKGLKNDGPVSLDTGRGGWRASCLHPA